MASGSYCGDSAGDSAPDARAPSVVEEAEESSPSLLQHSDSSSASTAVIDAAEFEELSKSVPTTAPMLEPEAVDNAIMRSAADTDIGDLVRKRRMSSAEQASYVKSAFRTDNSYDEFEPTETSPLVRQRSTTASEHPPSEASPLFLGGVSSGRFYAIFLQLMAANFVACFDGTILASSHPVITSYFGAAHSASWLSTAFLLTSTSFQPLLGRLSDAMGRKPLFIWCGVVFVAATVWCSLARTIEGFIAARALCGVGAGGSMTLGAIIVSDLVPIERRGTYQAYMNLVYGIASALGAATGGLMAEKLGWRWEFGVQVPLLVVCFGIGIIAIPEKLGVEDGKKTVWEALREFDLKGSTLLTLSVTFFILGLNLGGNVLRWTHPFVIISLVVFVITAPCFLWVESRVKKPVMPMNLIRQAPRANLIFSNFVLALLSNAIIFNMPIFYQAVLLMSATNSGLSLVVPSVVSSITGTITGFAVGWTRRLKWPLLWSAVLLLIGTLCLCFLERGLPTITYFIVLLPMAVGQGLGFPGTFLAILSTSAQSEQAVVTSTLILWRSVGSVLGIATSSLVLQNALLSYLGANVQGELKDEVIARVRRSVEAVADLEPPYQDQVIASYEAALRLTFIVCTAFAVISVVLVAPIKLPRLGVRK